MLGGLARQAAEAAKADRAGAALLAAVSNGLRAPLAAAKAAVSGLRSGDDLLTADDREELLAAAEESLDRLAHLAASLLDVSRLQQLTARTVGDRVELHVIDHGPGIPVADRKRVFLSFHRLGAPGDPAGVGLGLAVAHGLAEAMGGSVEPQETPGGGLTMVVSLPVACARPAAEVSDARRIRAA